MQTNSKWSLSTKEKDRLIAALTPELATLRTKADISQEDLAELIGVSRQTYGALERGARKMSWTTFLSLVLFYDCNQKTHQTAAPESPIPSADFFFRFFTNAEIPIPAAQTTVVSRAIPTPTVVISRSISGISAGFFIAVKNGGTRLISP